MCATPRALLLLATVVCLVTLSVFGQDAPSLAESARQARQQEKAQPGNGPSPRKAAKVVTDEEAPQPTPEPVSSSNQGRPATNVKPASAIQKLSAGEWKEQIQAQKNGISALQTSIDKLNASIHFLGASCSGCAQWNERQMEKKQEVERARSRLEEEKKRLMDMQEAARQQGYGSSVYDP